MRQDVAVVGKAVGKEPKEPLIDNQKFFKILRQMGYDYAGTELCSIYHEMNPKAHRIMNRFAQRLQKDGVEQEIDLSQVLLKLFNWRLIEAQEFYATLLKLGVRKGREQVMIHVAHLESDKAIVNRDQLTTVVEFYLQNAYLKSFGCKKTRIPIRLCYKMPGP